MSVQTIGKPFKLLDGSILPFSIAARAGGLVLVYGHMGVNKNLKIVEGGIEAQTTRFLRNMERVGRGRENLKDLAKILI